MTQVSSNPTPTNAASSGVSIDKKLSKQLIKRSDKPGLIWLTQWTGLLLLSGYAMHLSEGSIAFIPLLIAYGIIIALPAYALSHECAHGTAFRSRWLNEALLWISSLLYYEEPYYRRYAHARHHTYTWQNGLDAQMPFATPMTLRGWLLEVSGLGYFIFVTRTLLANATGKFSGSTREFTPASELPKLKWGARIFISIYAAIAIAILFGADFLFWYLVLPRIAGNPILFLYTLIQHVDMEEDQMDLRKSTRSFKTSAFSRFLYMNMNYHVEHHMYPTVPFHAMLALNTAIKDQLPEPDPGFFLTNYRVLKTIIARSMGKIPMVNLGKSITLS
ncbi:MAG: fatty acid desaturase [Gammaproteobacteria bacterium]|nr:fatty acid desaturase [Gammaproteobacteria bacterium]